MHLAGGLESFLGWVWGLVFFSPPGFGAKGSGDPGYPGVLLKSQWALGESWFLGFWGLEVWVPVIRARV